MLEGRIVESIELSWIVVDTVFNGEYWWSKENIKRCVTDRVLPSYLWLRVKAFNKVIVFVSGSIESIEL